MIIFIIFDICRSVEVAALSSATQYAMSLEFDGKWKTECLDIWFPQPNLMCAGYSVKLII